MHWYNQSLIRLPIIGKHFALISDTQLPSGNRNSELLLGIGLNQFPIFLQMMWRSISSTMDSYEVSFDF